MANAARVTYPATLQRCKLDAPLLAAGLLTKTAVNNFHWRTDRTEKQIWRKEEIWVKQLVKNVGRRS